MSSGARAKPQRTPATLWIRFASKTPKATPATSQAIVDIQAFLAWVTAVSAEDTRQADFLRHRFSDTLRPALAEWLASAPEGTIPEGTPFELPTYELAAARQATAFLSRADQHPAASREANQTGDNYILATVQVAAVLFSAGVSTKFPTAGVRRAVLGLGVVVWVVALGIVLALSRSIGF